MKEEKYYKWKAVVVAIFVFIFFPALARASDFFFDSTSEQLYQGDTFVVQLKLSTTDNLINAVEGNLSFDNNQLEVKEVSTGGSIFSLWPQPAATQNDKGEINFVGGVMGGFQGANAEILKIIFFAKNEGTATVALSSNSLLFLNDGQGTKVAYTSEPLNLSILKRPAGLEPKDEWQPFLEEDKNSPEPFEIVIDRNPAMFGNKYFASFFTTDKESGIDHYEIKEGEGVWVKADSPYELKDQSLRGKIEVRAVDKAGNERISVLQPPHPVKMRKFLFWGIIILTLVLLFLGGSVWRKKRHSSNR